jgi:hypothetical protein
MEEKKSRNQELYIDWLNSVKKYSVTGLQEDKLSYRKLGKKYGISAPAIRIILHREIKKRQ